MNIAKKIEDFLNALSLEYTDFKDILPYVAASSGTAEGDFERLCDILEHCPDVKFICLDVANG